MNHEHDHEAPHEPSEAAPRPGDGQRAGLPQEELLPRWRRWQRREVTRPGPAHGSGHTDRALEDPHA